MKKDYYLILGVCRSESTEGIKSAFRKLAKRHHPDKSGPEGTRRFQDIAEAYEVLSHPESRRRYTERLLSSERESRRTRFAPGRSRFAWEYESEQDSGNRDPYDRRSTTDDFIEALMEHFFSRMMQDMQENRFSSDRGFFRNKHAYESRFRGRPETIDLELILSEHEAETGGILPAEIFLSSPCRVCEGSGEMGPFFCPACGGRGVIERPALLRITIPPNITAGSVLEGRIGTPAKDFLIRIHVRLRYDD